MIDKNYLVSNRKFMVNNQFAKSFSYLHPCSPQKWFS